MGSVEEFPVMFELRMFSNIMEILQDYSKTSTDFNAYILSVLISQNESIENKDESVMSEKLAKVSRM